MAAMYRGGDPSRVYYGTDTHTFGLLFGAALALAVAKAGAPRRGRIRHRPLADFFAVSCFAALVAAIVVDWGNDVMFRGGIAVVTLLTVPIVLAATRPGPVGRMLSWRPLVLVGMVSYGIYLWHFPVWTILTPDRVGAHNALALELIRCAVLGALAAISFVAIEQPIRRGALRSWRTKVAIPATVCAVAIALVATTSAPTVFTEPIAASEIRHAAAEPLGEGPPAVMIVGDSTAGSATPGFEQELASAYRVVPGGPFVPPVAGKFCSLDLDMSEVREESGKLHDTALDPACDWSVTWPPIIDAFRPRVVVMMFGLFDAYPRRVNGEWLNVGTPEYEQHLARARSMRDRPPHRARSTCRAGARTEGAISTGQLGGRLQPRDE